MKTSYRIFSLLAGTLLIAGTALGDEYRLHRDLLYGQPAQAETAVVAEYDVDRDILYSVK